MDEDAHPWQKNADEEMDEERRVGSEMKSIYYIIKLSPLRTRVNLM